VTLLLLAALPAHAEACPERTNRAHLTSAIALARASFESGDLASFEAAVGQAEQALACLGEPVQPADVTALHLVLGLQRWDAAAPDAAAPWLTAVHHQGLDLGPREAQVVASAQGDAAASALRTPLPPTTRGRLQVDGQSVELSAPSAQPWVFQRITSDRVLDTTYVLPGGPLPSYPRLRRQLALGGGASALAAGGLLGVALLQHQRLSVRAPETPEAELDRRVRANNASLVGSALFAGASVASVVAIGLSFVW